VLAPATGEARRAPDTRHPVRNTCAFKQTTVAVPPPPGTPGSGRYGVVPAKRAITIRRSADAHRGASSYGQGSLAEAEYKKAGIIGWYLATKRSRSCR